MVCTFVTFPTDNVAVLTSCDFGNVPICVSHSILWPVMIVGDRTIAHLAHEGPRSDAAAFPLFLSLTSVHLDTSASDTDIRPMFHAVTLACDYRPCGLMLRFFAWTITRSISVLSRLLTSVRRNARLRLVSISFLARYLN